MSLPILDAEGIFVDEIIFWKNDFITIFDITYQKMSISTDSDVEADKFIQEMLDRTLCWGSRLGRINVVRICLSKGADVHTQNDRPLLWAMELGHQEIVQLLLEHDTKKPH